MLSTNLKTAFNVGLCLSGFGHVVLISCALFGGFFISKSLPLAPLITKVSIISEKDFKTKVILERERFLKAQGSSVERHNTEINNKKLLDGESTSLIIPNGTDTKSTVVKDNKLNLKKVSEKSELLQREAGALNPSLDRTSLFESEILEPLITKSVAKEDNILQRNREFFQNLPVIKISDKIIKEAFENDISNDLVVKKMLKGILEPAVGECFNFGLAGQEPNILKADILVSFSLRENGKPIISSISFESFSGSDYMTASKLFDAARRAIIRCGLKGYQLPNSKYSYWKNVEARFNLKGMSLK